MVCVKSNVLVDILTKGRITSTLVDAGLEVISTSSVDDEELVTVAVYWPCCKSCASYMYYNHNRVNIV